MGLWIALDLPHDHGVGRAIFLSWRALAAPVHMAANLLSPFTDEWPDLLDAAAALVAGLMPYAFADWLRRRWRASRRGGSGPPHA
jgi:hypothetical protein